MADTSKLTVHISLNFFSPWERQPSLGKSKLDIPPSISKRQQFSGAILGFHLGLGVIGVLDICLANCHNLHNMDGHKWITVVLTEAAIGSKITVQTSVQLKYVYTRWYRYMP